MRLPPVLILPVALVACSQAEEAPVQSEVAATSAADAAVLEPGEQSLADPAPGSVTAPAAELIPAAMRGRWGMTANDCDPARSDAKGLMIVGADSLEFYESHATLNGVIAGGADTVRARFSYVGEGMEWETEETLNLQRGNEVLVRRSAGQDGAFGPFEYRRCI